jgi:hypothetical protein
MQFFSLLITADAMPNKNLFKIYLYRLKLISNIQIAYYQLLFRDPYIKN